eukprot:TRINITY_DN20658_c0_g1_i2.p1 TRINITY_DN20658_c0_g1~~TRINITY_DN20658_c0_g1_i2.p1  ORF type:complete len:1089 (+),score=325.28 TRINITY_DN20658_c0_g1_i2:3-3269(+)
MAIDKLVNRRSVGPDAARQLAQQAAATAKQAADKQRVEGLLKICAVLQSWFGLRAKRFVRKWRAVYKLSSRQIAAKPARRLVDRYSIPAEAKPAEAKVTVKPEPELRAATAEPRRQEKDNRIAALEASRVSGMVGQERRRADALEGELMVAKHAMEALREQLDTAIAAEKSRNKELQLELAEVKSQRDRSKQMELRVEELQDELEQASVTANRDMDQISRLAEALTQQTGEQTALTTECERLRKELHQCQKALQSADETVHSLEEAAEENRADQEALSQLQGDRDRMASELSAAREQLKAQNAQMKEFGAMKGDLAKENDDLHADLEKVLAISEMSAAENTELIRELRTMERELSQSRSMMASQSRGLMPSPRAIEAPAEAPAPAGEEASRFHELRNIETTLRVELDEANASLQAARAQIGQLSRSSSPTRMRSTGAEELLKAKLQQQLAQAREELTSMEATLNNERSKPPADTGLMARVIKAGGLSKKGQFTWNDRWCVLDGTWFKVFNEEANQAKVKYVIALDRLTQVKLEGECQFRLSHEDGESLLFKAKDVDEVNEWLQAFQKAKELPMNIASPSPAPVVVVPRPLSSFQELDRGYVAALAKADNKTSIKALPELYAQPGVAVAEAILELGWKTQQGEPATEQRTVLTMLSPHTSPDSDGQCRAMLCFNFSPLAESLSLSLQLPERAMDVAAPAESVMGVWADPHAKEEAPPASPLLKLAQHYVGKSDVQDGEEANVLAQLRDVFDIFAEENQLEVSDMPEVLRSMGIPLPDSDLDGLLDRQGKGPGDALGWAEYEKLIMSCLEARNVPSSSELQTVFELFDLDGNGSIDVTELAEAMQALGMDATGKEVDKVFASVDRDGNGKIDFTEFTSIIKGVPTEKTKPAVAQHVAVTVDKQPTNGSLSQAHANKVLAAFELFDVDNSGSIDVSELSEAMEALGFNLLEHQIEQLVAGRVLADPGEMNIEEFVAVVTPLLNDSTLAQPEPQPKVNAKYTAPVLPPVAPAPAPESKVLESESDWQLKEVFQLFDLDGSGAIDSLELRDAMDALGVEVSHEELELIMQGADTSSDGLIDYNEFDQIMRPLL